VSSLRTLLVEQQVPLSEVAASSSLTYSGDEFTGEISNAGSLPLNDALLVYGSQALELGTLAPGEVREVASTDAAAVGFPFGVDASSEGLFNRQNVLNTMFDPDRLLFMGNMQQGGNVPQTVLDSEGVYLLAWQDAALVEADLDTGAVEQGLTLYVVRLRGS
jgi:hypothetical protein